MLATTELSWYGVRDCLDFNYVAMSEVAKTDIAGSHGLTLTGPSMTFTSDRFLIDSLITPETWEIISPESILIMSVRNI